MQAPMRFFSKFQMLENEMDLHAENLKSIVEQGREMAKAGHFDSAGILKKVDAFDRRSVTIILAGVVIRCCHKKSHWCVCIKIIILLVMSADLNHLKHPLLIGGGNWRIRLNFTNLTLTLIMRCNG